MWKGTKTVEENGRRLRAIFSSVDFGYMRTAAATDVRGKHMSKNSSVWAWVASRIQCRWTLRVMSSWVIQFSYILWRGLSTGTLAILIDLLNERSRLREGQQAIPTSPTPKHDAPPLLTSYFFCKSGCIATKHKWWIEEGEMITLKNSPFQPNHQEIPKIRKRTNWVT